MAIKRISVIILFIFLSIHTGSGNLQKHRNNIEDFLNSIQSKTTGLFNSFQNTATWIEDNRFYPKIPLMRTAKGYLDSQAFLYDNCLCIIALIDLERFKMAATILSTLEDNFFVSKNGNQGLFNSYVSTHFDYFFYTRPGVYNYLVMGIDGDRIHLGPNTWVGYAAQLYYFRTYSVEFVDFVFKMFLWAKNELAHYRLPNGNIGAPCMGFGWGAPWPKIFSTENIIDYYAFLDNTIKIIEKRDRRVLRIMKKNNITLNDVIREKNKTEDHLRQIGYNQRGTFNRGGFGPTPDGGYTVDTVEALDVNSWAVPALGCDKLKDMGCDPVELMRNCERKFRVKNTIQGRDYYGFDFTTTKGYVGKRQGPIIWWEGTGEMVLAYHLVAEWAEKKHREKDAEECREKYHFYLDQMDSFSDDVMDSSCYELPYVAYRIKEKEVSYTFNDWWPIARASRSGQDLLSSEGEEPWVICISSTLWRYFGAAKFNPFDADCPRNKSGFFQKMAALLF